MRFPFGRYSVSRFTAFGMGYMASFVFFSMFVTLGHPANGWSSLLLLLMLLALLIEGVFLLVWCWLRPALQKKLQRPTVPDFPPSLWDRELDA